MFLYTNFLIFIFFCLTACAGKPSIVEYVIAQSAIKNARKVNADKNATVYWVKALNYYNKGQQNFKNRDYISATQLFNESIKWAEKSENLSRFKISTGEGI